MLFLELKGLETISNFSAIGKREHFYSGGKEHAWRQ
jgi:hypothetical protein